MSLKDKFWKSINEPNAVNELKEVLSEVEAQGINAMSTLVNQKNDEGETALHVLSRTVPITEDLIKKIEIIFSYSPDVSLKSPAGKTARDLLDKDSIVHAYFEVYEYLKKIQSQQRVDFNRTSFLIQQALRDVTRLEAVQEGVFVIGNTRVGKSTLINYLLGVDYQIGKMGGRLTAIPKGEEVARVGRTTNSETFTPTMYAFSSTLSLVDFPGFNDNRIAESEQLNPYIVSANVGNFVISKKITQVKKLLLVFSWKNLTSENINDFRGPLLQYINMIQGSDIGEVLSKTQIWITKSNEASEDDPCTRDNILEKIDLLRTDIATGATLSTEQQNKLNQFFDYIRSYPEQTVVIPDINTSVTRETFAQSSLASSDALPINRLNFHLNQTALAGFQTFVASLDDYGDEIANQKQEAENKCRKSDAYLAQVEANLIKEIEGIEVNNPLPSVSKIEGLVQEVSSRSDEIVQARNALGNNKTLETVLTFFSQSVTKLRDFDPTLLPRVKV